MSLPCNVVQFGSFTCGWWQGQRRLYFSRPNDFQTWLTTDWIDVGSSYILHAFVMGDALWVECLDGCWIISGHLGATAVMRQLGEDLAHSGTQDVKECET